MAPSSPTGYNAFREEVPLQQPDDAHSYCFPSRTIPTFSIYFPSLRAGAPFSVRKMAVHFPGKQLVLNLTRERQMKQQDSGGPPI